MLAEQVQPAIVLGSGMAGLGAIHALAAEGFPSVCYDKNAYYGGHTTTFADLRLKTSTSHAMMNMCPSSAKVAGDARC
jgi:cation diffusion facilitator CzcD-associated flavoprotein CzcO